MNDPALFNVLVFLVAAFGLLVVAMMTMFFRVYVKLHNLQSNLNSEGIKIRKEAQEAAQEIMSKAQLNAQKIISDASSFNQNAKNVFDDEMKKATAVYASKYQELLTTLSESVQGLYKEVTRSISETSQTSTSEFDKVVSQALSQLQSDVQTEIKALRDNLNLVAENEKKSLREEYERIEKQKMALLEERIVGVVQSVARDSIKKTLTEREHEELILESLKRAKQKGVIGTNA